MGGGARAIEAISEPTAPTQSESAPTGGVAERSTDSRRVNVIFSGDQYDTLQRLAKMQNISLSDALRQAISLSDLIVNANAEPDTKILLRKGDSLQELKIVR
jgi:hypothetical protein